MNIKKNTSASSILERLSLAWSGLAIGVLLGVTGTYLFFQNEIQNNENPRQLLFGIYWSVIFMFLFVPPVVFSGIGRYLDYRCSRKAEPGELVNASSADGLSDNHLND